MERLGPGAVALVHSPPEAVRNGDAEYRFRQSSDLYYLTGFTEPEATLVLRPGGEQRTHLFVRPRDPEREQWTGRRAGVEGALAQLGADAAYPAGELRQRLPELIANVDELHYGVGIDPDFDRIVLAAIADLRRRERKGLRPPLRIVDPRQLLHEMRLHKQEDELALLRRAAEITAEAHLAAMRAAAPGVHEYELEALIEYTFRRRGGNGPGYTSIVGGGDNATILHYIDNARPLRDGDLVLIDAGCEYEFYTADVTRTFPVNGRFTAAQRRCYEVVLAAEEAGIAMARPGVTLGAIHERCVEILTQGMVELGLLAGPVAERIQDRSYQRHYMHRTSHWLGLDVHDAGAYLPGGAERALAPGMVITIEPGLYIGAEDTQAPAEYRGIGIRIEDDVHVHEGGCEVLTRAIPKQVADVEAACAGR